MAMHPFGYSENHSGSEHCSLVYQPGTVENFFFVIYSPSFQAVLDSHAMKLKLDPVSVS
jgi:hypothetical protein